MSQEVRTLARPEMTNCYWKELHGGMMLHLKRLSCAKIKELACDQNTLECGNWSRVAILED